MKGKLESTGKKPKNLSYKVTGIREADFERIKVSHQIYIPFFSILMVVERAFVALFTKWKLPRSGGRREIFNDLETRLGFDV